MFRIFTTITATEVQYLSQFTNMLLIALYFYPRFFGTRYHKFQIGACNFTYIYYADVVVSDRSRVEKCQSGLSRCRHTIISISARPTRLCWSSRGERSLKPITHSSQSAHPQHRHCLCSGPAQGFHSEYLHWYLNDLIILPDFFCMKILPWKTFRGQSSFWYESVSVYTSPEYILEYFCPLKKFQQGPMYCKITQKKIQDVMSLVDAAVVPVALLFTSGCDSIFGNLKTSWGQQINPLGTTMCKRNSYTR
jgi:hypothetical protein